MLLERKQKDALLILDKSRIPCQNQANVLSVLCVGDGGHKYFLTEGHSVELRTKCSAMVNSTVIVGNVSKSFSEVDRPRAPKPR